MTNVSDEHAALIAARDAARDAYVKAKNDLEDYETAHLSVNDMRVGDTAWLQCGDSIYSGRIEKFLTASKGNIIAVIIAGDRHGTYYLQDWSVNRTADEAYSRAQAWVERAINATQEKLARIIAARQPVT